MAKKDKKDKKAKKATSKAAISSGSTPDNVFQLLVHVANTSHMEMRVTLHVHGLVLTGKLISGATYWSETAAELRGLGEGPTELIDAMASSMESVADEYRERFGGKAKDASEDFDDFVHLRDARTVSSQGPVPAAGGFWRGRLTSVDGFSFGELQ